VYLCGPAGFTDQVRSVLRDLAVPDARIHSEEFEL
jgi:ferredoxin-NADP reductase